jgi:O-antigen/teichoic acid export membrane protein
MKNWITKYRANQLANNTAWMLLGQGLCLFIQAAYFVIIARSLGVQQYGAFIAAAAFVQILSPFVGFGGGNLLVKNVAQDKKLFAVYWGNLLFMTLTSGLAATAFVIAVARLVLPPSIPLLVIVLVSLADLIFSRLVECAAFAFQAIERLDVTAQLKIWAALTRLMGIALLAAILRHPDARHWSFVYLLTTIIGATLGLVWVHIRIGRPRLLLGAIRGEFIQGLYFSASLSAQNIYNDIDKTMLARMATLDAVGIYAVAYRIIDIAFIPVRSLLYSAYAGFFRAGQDGISGTIRYMRRLLPKSACYSFLAFLGLILGAPIVRYLFGSEYARTVEALRWLAVLPLLKTVHYFLADTLTCSGHQGCRALIQGMVAGFNVVINLWIIPLYSWRGAAWSSVASDTLLAASMYLAVLVMSRASKQPKRYQAGDLGRAPMACSPGNAVENIDPVSLQCVSVTSPPNRVRADTSW